MKYLWIWNPKTVYSGMITCIPQKGLCPNKCADCFFQSGRSYLEPLEENLPHIPPYELTKGRIVRMNDGNDSNIQRELVEKTAKQFDDYFFNTSMPKDLEKFSGPVVLTVNPGKMTDNDFYKIGKKPVNLMFVRVRTNTWNLENVVNPAISYYTQREVPVVLTFMAYFDTKIKQGYEYDYVFRKRTLNSYYAIITASWKIIMEMYRYNPWVYSCGKIEGEKGITKCSRCGNCIREYYNTKERMKFNIRVGNK